MNVLKNYMEDIVLEFVDSVSRKLDVCSCANCRLDITAIALNLLPPKYVVTNKGMIYTKVAAFRSQYEVDVISALTVAAERVKNNPRHD